MPEIAFAGRSNVGKSSLINSLMQRKRLARVGETPGKTRTINYYKVDALIKAPVIVPADEYDEPVLNNGSPVQEQPAVSATEERSEIFHLVDLPGYGYAKVSQSEKERWAELVEGYFAQQRNIPLVIQICDMRHPPTADDMMMIDFLCSSGYNFIIALTKMDKLKKTQQQRCLEEIKEKLCSHPEIRLFPCSSENGEGIEAIRNVISSAVAEHREK